MDNMEQRHLFEVSIVFPTNKINKVKATKLPYRPSCCRVFRKSARYVLLTISGPEFIELRLNQLCAIFRIVNQCSLKLQINAFIELQQKYSSVLTSEYYIINV